MKKLGGATAAQKKSGVSAVPKKRRRMLSEYPRVIELLPQSNREKLRRRQKLPIRLTTRRNVI